MTPTILLVDDEVHLCEALERLLRQDGYRIIVAHNGTDALALLAGQRADLAIIDYHMPGMNGLELAARLRVLHPATVRLLLTSHADFSVALEAINRAAIYRYLVKPPDPAKLRIDVALALDEARRLAGGGR